MRKSLSPHVSILSKARTNLGEPAVRPTRNSEPNREPRANRSDRNGARTRTIPHPLPISTDQPTGNQKRTMKERERRSSGRTSVETREMSANLLPWLLFRSDQAGTPPFSSLLSMRCPSSVQLRGKAHARAAHSSCSHHALLPLPLLHRPARSEQPSTAALLPLHPFHMVRRAARRTAYRQPQLHKTLEPADPSWQFDHGAKQLEALEVFQRPSVRRLFTFLIPLGSTAPYGFSLLDAKCREHNVAPPWRRCVLLLEGRIRAEGTHKRSAKLPSGEETMASGMERWAR
nr:unnamed protein product [Digitaria exilis]